MPSTVRSRGTSPCSVWAALGGGASPANASTKASAVTTCPACTTSSASTSRWRGLPTAWTPPAATTSSGPSTRTRTGDPASASTGTDDHTDVGPVGASTPTSRCGPGLPRPGWRTVRRTTSAVARRGGRLGDVREVLSELRA